jgi:putative phosphoribosyl transferase
VNIINQDSQAKLRIVSRSGEPFQTRQQAGRLLGEELSPLRRQKAVVLGIPRGGIVVAQTLAQGLDADLDIVLSRKLGAPGDVELAMGALAEDGEVFLNQYVVDALWISSAYIDQEKARQMAEIQRRSQLIRATVPKIPLQGRIVIITDDGLATGATMQVAVWAVRRENPLQLIAAIPVASEEAVTRLAGDVDAVVCLRMPPHFMAVGQFYLEFNQVSDEEVLEILRRERRI